MSTAFVFDPATMTGTEPTKRRTRAFKSKWATPVTIPAMWIHTGGSKVKGKAQDFNEWLADFRVSPQWAEMKHLFWMSVAIGAGWLFILLLFGAMSALI